MATDQEQAKQLDSVTDVVQEKELDTNKAAEAMASLSAAKQAAAATVPTIQVSKEDVNLIMTEMEVTEDEAVRALQKTALEGLANGKSLPVETLRRMVTS